MSSSLIGQRMGIEVFRRHGAARAKALADYFDYARHNDLLPHLRHHQSAGRPLARTGAQQAEDLVARIVDEDAAGITIRGAKMLGTGAIMANEVFVANMQPLKPGEEDIAFSCALPMNAKGLRVLSRKSYEAHAVSVFDNPLSSRFDENDALLYFDDVKVPWERVFVHRDTDMCRAQFHDTPAHVYQNYQAQIRLVGEADVSWSGSPSASPRRSAPRAFRRSREQLGTLAAQGRHGRMPCCRAWRRRACRPANTTCPNSTTLYAAQVLTQELYPRFVQTRSAIWPAAR